MSTLRRLLHAVHRHHPLRCEQGEGVISAAIAVLVMAFLGALMWVGFQAIWADAEQRTSEQIQQIGG